MRRGSAEVFRGNKELWLRGGVPPGALSFRNVSPHLKHQPRHPQHRVDRPARVCTTVASFEQGEIICTVAVHVIGRAGSGRGAPEKRGFDGREE